MKWSGSFHGDLEWQEKTKLCAGNQYVHFNTITTVIINNMPQNKVYWKLAAVFTGILIWGRFALCYCVARTITMSLYCMFNCNKLHCLHSYGNRLLLERFSVTGPVLMQYKGHSGRKHIYTDDNGHTSYFLTKSWSS